MLSVFSLYVHHFMMDSYYGLYCLLFVLSLTRCWVDCCSPVCSTPHTAYHYVPASPGTLSSNVFVFVPDQSFLFCFCCRVADRSNPLVIPSIVLVFYASSLFVVGCLFLAIVDDALSPPSVVCPIFIPQLCVVRIIVSRLLECGWCRCRHRFLPRCHFPPPAYCASFSVSGFFMLHCLLLSLLLIGYHGFALFLLHWLMVYPFLYVYSIKRTTERMSERASCRS